MTKFKSQKEIVQSIASNLEDLEAGNLSLEALEMHIDLVRELYERSIMLRYKAFEKSLGKEIESEEIEITVPIIEQKIEEIAEPTAIEEEEVPEIEFSLFEENEEEIEEEIFVPEPIIEQKIEPIIEASPIIESTPKEIHEPISLAEAGEFLSKFQSVENELSKQIGFSKLETLVGSFGLNERLQYINELFDGSSEVFSDAIKSLDVLPNINTAKSLTADLAIQNNWDVESDTVEEFIQKICRRYA